MLSIDPGKQLLVATSQVSYDSHSPACFPKTITLVGEIPSSQAAEAAETLIKACIEAKAAREPGGAIPICEKRHIPQEVQTRLGLSNAHPIAWVSSMSTSLALAYPLDLRKGYARTGYPHFVVAYNGVSVYKPGLWLDLGATSSLAIFVDELVVLKAVADTDASPRVEIPPKGRSGGGFEFL